MESLRSPAEFRRVMEEGRRRPVGGVVVVGASNPGGPPRVGFTVSKSVGNSVTRNRARRRLRHTVREIELQPNTDYVIIARRAVLDAPYQTLVGWVRRAVSELADA